VKPRIQHVGCSSACSRPNRERQVRNRCTVCSSCCRSSLLPSCATGGSTAEDRHRQSPQLHPAAGTACLRHLAGTSHLLLLLLMCRSAAPHSCHAGCLPRAAAGALCSHRWWWWCCLLWSPSMIWDRCTCCSVAVGGIEVWADGPGEAEGLSPANTAHDHLLQLWQQQQRKPHP